jgi:hypothetical protein
VRLPRSMEARIGANPCFSMEVLQMVQFFEDAFEYQAPPRPYRTGNKRPR